VGALSWSAFAVVIACLAAMLWVVHRVVVTPVRRVSRATARAGEAGIAAVHTSALRYSAADAASRNEVHQLGVAVKRLLRSLKAREPGREHDSKEGADEGAHVT
jgi:HAMP domain-containing protein